MSGLHVPQPQYDRAHDLVDPTDAVDRGLEMAWAKASVIQRFLLDIKFDPKATATAAPQVARTAGTFPRPTHVTSGNVATYETLISDALTAVTTLVGKLKSAQATQ